MQNLKNFSSFLNEKRNNKPESIYHREDYDATDKIKEIRRRVEAQTGEERLYQTVYDEGGALQRLIKGPAEKVQSIGKGISDLFNSPKISKLDADDLKKNKTETLSKWGDSIKLTGKNKEKDYEEFYRDAIKRGKSTFGKDYDINDPSTKDERVYRDYVLGASKYFDFKPDGKNSKL